MIRRFVTPKTLATPKALANSSPGLLQPWVRKKKGRTNAESVGKRLAESLPTLKGLVALIFLLFPGLKQPRAETCERLRRSALPHAVAGVVGQTLRVRQCFEGAQDLDVAIEQHAGAGVV